MSGNDLEKSERTIMAKFDADYAIFGTFAADIIEGVGIGDAQRTYGLRVKRAGLKHISVYVSDQA